MLIDSLGCVRKTLEKHYSRHRSLLHASLPSFLHSASFHSLTTNQSLQPYVVMSPSVSMKRKALDVSICFGAFQCFKQLHACQMGNKTKYSLEIKKQICETNGFNEHITFKMRTICHCVILAIFYIYIQILKWLHSAVYFYTQSIKYGSHAKKDKKMCPVQSSIKMYSSTGSLEQLPPLNDSPPVNSHINIHILWWASA